MTDILRLPSWVASSVEETEERIVIHATYTKQPEVCHACGVVNAPLYKHGSRETTFLDTPIGKPTRIQAKVQRYRCRECSGLFMQPLEGIDAERRMTLRCVAYIGKQCLVDTFQRVSEHLGCDEKTIRNVAAAHIIAKDEGYQPYLPEWIGLDETHLNDEMRAIITDVSARRPVDLLPNRDKPLLRKWFRQFSDYGHVKGLVIDMWRPYLDVASELFPNVPVVIDKFHVVKMSNAAVERSRIRLGKAQGKKVNLAWKRSKALIRMRHRDLTDKQLLNLDIWLSNEPEMSQAYWLKERLFNLYDKPKDEAIADYDSFASEIPDHLKADFNELTRAMKNWRKEILNYFDYPITNAYTESVNGVTKVMNRMGRGYSFDVIRARVLFNDRKPTARQLRAKRAAERKILYRCACCHGLFPPAEMDADERVLAAAREFTDDHTAIENAVLVCIDCEERFNHEERTHSIALSTTYSG